MADDFYDYDEGLAPQRKDHLFLWTIFILLLIGAAIACWLGSIYVFSHPEDARCYEILKKMHKIEPPRRFDVTAAPLGEFLSPQRLYDRYSVLTPLELQRENDELLRIYIRNYSETKKPLPYLRGKFEVMDATSLGAGDAFQQGVVALMQAQEYPQIVIEHLFPASAANIEMSKRLLAPGFPFSVEKTNDVTTVLHVARIADGRLLITVMPLHYPSYALKGGAGTFASEPPAAVNVAASLPVTKAARLGEALQRYAQLRAREQPAADLPDRPVATGPEVVRLDTLPLGTKAPVAGAIPEPPVAKAEPVRPRTTPPPQLAMNTRPALPVEGSHPILDGAPISGGNRIVARQSVDCGLIRWPGKRHSLQTRRAYCSA